MNDITDEQINNKYNYKKIEKAVLETVCDQFNLRGRFEQEEHAEGEVFDIDSVRSLQFIKDLNTDCLDVIELVMEIEIALNTEISDDMLEAFFGSNDDILDAILYDHTVQELIDYLNKNLD